jgi:hypothetical protein
MLLAIIVSSRWVMHRLDLPLTLGSTIPMGVVALGILAPAEITGVLWVRGQSFHDYAASYVTAPGVMSLCIFLLFAAMPNLVTLVRRGHVGAICGFAQQTRRGGSLVRLPGGETIRESRDKGPS